jgi:hypothetical protein
LTATGQRCEQLLLAAYSEEAECYTRALSLAEALCAACRDGGIRVELIQSIVARMDEVTEIENRMAEPKQHWRGGGFSPGLQLANLLNRLEELIRQLSERIREAEDLLSARKSALAPEFETLIRSQRMLRAYGMNR